MSKKNKLGIVIGTKDEAYWTTVKELADIECSRLGNTIIRAKADIENIEKELRLRKEISKLAQNKILLEKRK